MFGDKGLMPETRATVVQLNGLLADARTSLKKVDAVLVEAQAIGANVKEGSNDLGVDRKSTRLNSSHVSQSRMPSSA